MMFQQHSVDDRYAEKDRRTIFFEDPADHVWRGLVTTKNRSEPIQQGKSKTVTEAVREWQTRRRKQSIACAQSQDFAGESLVCIEDVGLAVYRAFRLARAA